MEVQAVRRQRLEELIREAGSAAALARAAGTDPAYLSQIRTSVKTPRGTVRNIGEKLARALERGMGKQQGWMDSQTPEVGTKPGLTVDAEGARGNTSLAPAIQDEGLPLISWVQAGDWADVADPYEGGDYEKLVPVTRRYSKRAYALRIQGDSMQAPEGDSFPPGSIICVEPEQQARNGSYVVVRLEASQEATFKQLVIEGGETYLKPLNPRYPIIKIDGEATFCGVVRQLVMDFD